MVTTPNPYFVLATAKELVSAPTIVTESWNVHSKSKCLVVKYKIRVKPPWPFHGDGGVHARL